MLYFTSVNGFSELNLYIEYVKDQHRYHYNQHRSLSILGPEVIEGIENGPIFREFNRFDGSSCGELSIA
jgi:hypothetical protein